MEVILEDIFVPFILLHVLTVEINKEFIFDRLLQSLWEESVHLLVHFH